MSWVVDLIPGKLYIGPVPSSYAQLGYLVCETRVDYILNILPKLDAIRIDYEKHNDKLKAEQHPTAQLIQCAFDPSVYKPQGRDQKQKLADMAAFYVKHAEKLWKLVEAHSLNEQQQQQHIFYLHSKTGDTDEVLIGFALAYFMTFRLKSVATHFPKNDPCQWIVDHNYEHLLNDDNDAKELLRAMWDEVQRVARARKFFSIKRQKV